MTGNAINKKNPGPFWPGIHAPGETRTPNLLIRSQMLYPIELRALPRDAWILYTHLRPSNECELRTKVAISFLSVAYERYKTRTCDLHDVNVAL